MYSVAGLLGQSVRKGTTVTKLPNLVLYIRAHLLRLIVYEALDVFVWVQDYSYAL